MRERKTDRREKGEENEKECHGRKIDKEGGREKEGRYV